MSNDLRHLFEDPGAGEPRPSVEDIKRKGLRRRWIHRSGATLSVMLVFTLGAAAALTLTRADRSDIGVQRATGPAGAEQVVFVKNGDLFRMTLDGSEPQNITASPEEEISPSWSPDGERIAFVRVAGPQSDAPRDIYVINADGSGLEQLTDDPAYDLSPEWSPDGSQIAFVRNLEGNDEIFVMNADGSQESQLTDNPSGDSSPSWSPDSREIAFSRDIDGGKSILLMARDGSNVRRVTSGGFDDEPAWSPDRAQIAFTRTIGQLPQGRADVFLMDADGANVRQLTDDPGIPGDLSWVGNGDRLVFFEAEDLTSTPRTFHIYVMNSNGSNKRQVTRSPIDWVPEPDVVF
jgi:Tol biopolymer transport system component